MTYTVKISFYPKFINKISSFHILNDEQFKKLNLIINDDSLFIDNFFRTSKNTYEYLCSSNIEILEIEDNNEIEFIRKYIDIINNDFDLYEMITSNYIEDSNDSITSLSDEDLQDTINILKIFKYDLNNKPEEVNNIINDNPHLLEDENLSEWF